MTKLSTTPLSLSLNQSFKVDLLKPYFSSNTNWRYHSRGRLGNCKIKKKVQTETAQLHKLVSVEVSQEAKYQGKKTRK